MLDKSTRRIRAIVIHCTATPPRLAVTHGMLHGWHSRRGFSDIGYHLVIARDGSHFKGRSVNIQGAHARTNGWNRGTIAVSLVGGIGQHTNRPEANFTQAQMNTLRRALNMFKAQYGDDILVIGHHDTGAAKDCPCFDVIRWVDKGEVVFADRKTWLG